MAPAIEKGRLKILSSAASSWAGFWSADKPNSQSNRQCEKSVLRLTRHSKVEDIWRGSPWCELRTEILSQAYWRGKFVEVVLVLTEAIKHFVFLKRREIP